MTSDRPLIVTENISANGVIDFLDPWFDADAEDTDDLNEATSEQMAAQTDLLLGRLTFEAFRGYWPLQLDDTSGVTAHLNKVHKHVLSATLTDPEWENSTVHAGALLDEVRALKAAPGGELGLTGSVSVLHALMQADLVDEYRLLVYPVLTSRGRNLVPDGMSMHGVTLAASRTFRSGVVLLHYLRS